MVVAVTPPTPTIHAATAAAATVPLPHAPARDDEYLLVVLPGAAGRRPVLERLTREYAPVRLAVLVTSEDTARCQWARALVEAQDFIQSRGGPADVDAAIAALRRWGKPLTGILCYDEFGLELSAHLCETFDLPGTRPATMRTIRDKALFRKVCNHIPHVITSRCRPCTAELVEAIVGGAQAWSFPSILKPRSGAGSWYIQQVDSVDVLAAAYPALMRELRSNKSFPEEITSAGYLLEEMVVGQEVDVDGWAEHGRVVFAQVNDNRPVIWPSMCEVGGHYPSLLPDAMQGRIRALTQDVITALGHGDDQFHGAFHFEAIANADGVFPIELNARVGGAECPSCVEATTGHWLPARATELALGRRAAGVARPRYAAVVSVNIHLATGGVLTRMDSAALTPEVQDALGVAQIVLWGQSCVGKAYVQNNGSQSCLGWVATGGRDVHEARERMREVVSLLRIDVDGIRITPEEILAAAHIHPSLPSDASDDAALSDVSTHS